jgi:uncharacterized protein YegL
MGDVSTMPVHVLFVLDASGSMWGKRADVIGGFNEYVARLCETGGPDYRLTAISFDDTLRTICAGLKLHEVPILDEQRYRIGGNTALFDALGTGMQEVTDGIKTDGHPFGEDRVLVIIMTDGEENASTHYDKPAIVQMIAERSDAGNWTFVYLGADQDAWQHAAPLGIKQQNTVSYDGASTRAVFTASATSTTAYATSNATDATWHFQHFTVTQPGEDTPTS